MSPSLPRAYIEAKVSVPPELVDVVCDFIVEHVSSGLVLEEVEGAAETGILFYVPEQEQKDWRAEMRTFLSRLAAEWGVSVPSMTERIVESMKWEEEYRRSVQPVYIGDDIVIRPPWYSLAEPVRYEIIIEPKMAFGTGSHETTRSCLHIIRKHFRDGMRFLDVGCGSGILSILADRMNAGFIKAVDYDETAVENCRENFRLNQVKSPYELIHGSIETCRQDAPYDMVCANIIKETIVAIMNSLIALTREKGFLVLSGLLDKDEEEIENLLKKMKLSDYTILRDGEWSTFTVTKG